MNDQTFGISKLNKLAITLDKKETYTCMLSRVCFLFKSQYENLKENVPFRGCCSFGLHRSRYCKIKYILAYYRLTPFTTHNLVFQLTQRTMGVHILITDLNEIYSRSTVGYGVIQ